MINKKLSVLKYLILVVVIYLIWWKINKDLAFILIIILAVACVANSEYLRLRLNRTHDFLIEKKIARFWDFIVEKNLRDEIEKSDKLHPFENPHEILDDEE